MLDTLINLQRDLIDALDRGDVDDVEAITRDIEHKIASRTIVAEKRKADVDYALKLNVAAGMRVNALNNWNDQKLTRIHKLRQKAVQGR